MILINWGSELNQAQGIDACVYSLITASSHSDWFNFLNLKTTPQA
jgi:hypothetical protein